MITLEEVEKLRKKEEKFIEAKEKIKKWIIENDAIPEKGEEKIIIFIKNGTLGEGYVFRGVYDGTIHLKNKELVKKLIKELPNELKIVLKHGLLGF